MRKLFPVPTRGSEGWAEYARAFALPCLDDARAEVEGELRQLSPQSRSVPVSVELLDAEGFVVLTQEADKGRLFGLEARDLMDFAWADLRYEDRDSGAVAEDWLPLTIVLLVTLPKEWMQQGLTFCSLCALEPSKVHLGVLYKLSGQRCGEGGRPEDRFLVQLALSSRESLEEQPSEEERQVFPLG